MAPLIGTEADEETADQRGRDTGTREKCIPHHLPLGTFPCTRRASGLQALPRMNSAACLDRQRSLWHLEHPGPSQLGNRLQRPFPLYGLWTLAGTSTSLLFHGYISRRGRIGIGDNRGSRDLGLDYPRSKSMVLCTSTHPNYQAPNQSKLKSKTRCSRITRRASEMIYIPTLSLV